MLNLEKYAVVSANDSDSISYTPGDGENIYVTMLSGDAAVNQDVKVQISWDGNTIFSTHNSNTQLAPEGFYLAKLEGNNSKQLIISLVNNSSQSEEIGGRVLGVRQYGS